MLGSRCLNVLAFQLVALFLLSVLGANFVDAISHSTEDKGLPARSPWSLSDELSSSHEEETTEELKRIHIPPEEAAMLITAQGQLLRSEADMSPQQVVAARAASARIEKVRHRAMHSTGIHRTEDQQVIRKHMDAIRGAQWTRAAESAAIVIALPVLLLALLLLPAWALLRRCLCTAAPSLETPSFNADKDELESGARPSFLAELSIVSLFMLLLAGVVLLMFLCVAWLDLVPGPFVQRFVCTDTASDQASSDVTPLVAEALRGFCWKGHRWEGISRREAELLLTGLQRSLVANPEGAVVEFGAGVGETTFWISRFLDLHARVTGQPRRTHRVYDTFAGRDFPQRNRMECDRGQDPAMCRRWILEWGIVRWPLNLLLQNRRWAFNMFLKSQGATMPRVYQGYFANMPRAALPSHVAFAVFDMDSYKSVSLSFKKCWSRLTQHGEVYIHGFKHSCCPGIRSAMQHYLKTKQPRGMFEWAGPRNGVTWAVGGPSLSYDETNSVMRSFGWRWIPAG